MVSSQVPGLTNTPVSKPHHSMSLSPTNPPDALVLDHIELDFSDVFGPLPIQTSNELNCGDEEGTELIYDDPVVIYSRSHSFVGPSTCVSQSFKLSRLTIHETEDSVELVECDNEGIIKGFKELSVECDVNLTDVQSVGTDDFEVLKVVGQGAFGKVFQVRKKGTSDIYAMKVMRKDKIMEKNQAEYMKAERDILTKIEHPFIVQLRYSFQTKYRLYLILDFVNGGHLFFQLYNHGIFREDLARIYAAEITSAVSHLHANGVMHRDLKPENILLDEDGHILSLSLSHRILFRNSRRNLQHFLSSCTQVMLTDFGVAKEFEENKRSNSMCGTVEYMSPEIILGQGHDKAADWWSVGILMFEMLTGKPPFIGNREKIQRKVVKEKIKLPNYLTSEAHSLLKGLLQKDPSKRLGSGPTGSEEIKGHKWFKPINWKKLEAREIQPSFRPEVAGKHCIANFETRWTDMPLLDSPAASPNATANHFMGFTYVKPAAPFLQRSSPLA